MRLASSLRKVSISALIHKSPLNWVENEINHLVEKTLDNFYDGSVRFMAIKL